MHSKREEIFNKIENKYSNCSNRNHIKTERPLLYNKLYSNNYYSNRNDKLLTKEKPTRPLSNINIRTKVNYNIDSNYLSNNTNKKEELINKVRNYSGIKNNNNKSNINLDTENKLYYLNKINKNIISSVNNNNNLIRNNSKNKFIYHEGKHSLTSDTSNNNNNNNNNVIHLKTNSSPKANNGLVKIKLTNSNISNKTNNRSKLSNFNKNNSGNLKKLYKNNEYTKDSNNAYSRAANNISASNLLIKYNSNFNAKTKCTNESKNIKSNKKLNELVSLTGSNNKKALDSSKMNQYSLVNVQNAMLRDKPIILKPKAITRPNNSKIAVSGLYAASKGEISSSHRPISTKQPSQSRLKHLKLEDENNIAITKNTDIFSRDIPIQQPISIRPSSSVKKCK